MHDADNIAAAYAEAVKGLFRVMTGSYAAAEGNAAMEQKADAAFKAGLILARRVRDRALAVAA